ncbi:MAG: hypothetical protein Q4D12_00145 [Bacteroidales bacterium]|nr:hypothetical protein [Bacteroidales bacterium]
MKKLFSLLLVVVACTLTSCNTKYTAVNHLRSFTNELEMNSKYYELQDWQRAKVKYERINDQLNKHQFDYTSEEKSEIGELQGRCAGYLAKSAVDKAKGFVNQVKGIVNGVKEVFGQPE